MGINTKRLRKLEQESNSSNGLKVIFERYPGQGRKQAMVEAGLGGINEDDPCIVFLSVADAGVL